MTTTTAFPNIVTDCDICDHGCDCAPGTAGCEHWGCWAAKQDATCPSAETHRADFYIRHPRFNRTSACC